MRRAKFLVFSSIWYETFGLVVLEAGILETPAIVGEPGAVAGLINDGEMGQLFSMGDEQALAEKLEWAFSHPAEMKKMGQAARLEFEQKYSAEKNGEMLMDIYEQALGVRL